jgi:hypothetical protein
MADARIGNIFAQLRKKSKKRRNDKLIQAWEEIADRTGWKC